MKIHFLAPKLQENNLDAEIVCYRPVRDGRPYIHAEITHHQLRVHNYGHGGSGFALLWGSVDHAIHLFLEKLKQNPSYQHQSINVIGAGVMGLVCALKLKELQQSHPQLNLGEINIFSEKINDIPSYYAAGLWTQVFMHNDPSGQTFVDTLGEHSLIEYLSIATGQTYPFLRDAIELQPYLVKADNKSGLEVFVERGLLPPPLRIEADFGKTQHNVLMYQTIFINIEIFMNRLHAHLKSQGINIQQKTINHFNEFAPDSIIFNCAGIGARELNHDHAMFSVCGHLITLKNQSKEFLDNRIASAEVLAPSAERQAAIQTLIELSQAYLSVHDQKIFILQLQTMLNDLSCLFANQQEKVLFYQRLAKLIYLIKSNYIPHAETVMHCYQLLIPRYFSRYMFVIRDQFKDHGSGLMYDGVIYFTVFNPDTAQNNSPHPQSSGYVVGKIGGTYLSYNELSLTTHEREFANLLDRIKDYLYGG